MRRMLPLLLSLSVVLAAGGCAWREAPVDRPGCEAIPTAPAGADPPRLTAGERRAALGAALADPAVHAIAGRRKARFRVGPWSTATLRPLGALVEIAWQGGVAGTGTWPVLHYDATETLTPPYRVVEARVRYSGVTRIHVSVLGRPWRVAGISVVRGTEDVELPAGALDGFPPQPHCH
jgi:hypothetical protein